MSCSPEISADLVQPNLAHDRDDEDLAEYAVGVNWIRALSLTEAKTFRGVFANQTIVCKLRDPATLEFLSTEFGVPIGS
ncbi:MULTISPECIES: hypothetical protein [Alphaproteobacteria]|uniref:hypothetical protein n=1 Tax=Alphaproteobacteria TaxID=28211 RepID=UPI003263A136